MKSKTSITVYEHDRLTTDNASFNHKHLNALLKLNEYHNFDYFDPIPNGVKFKQYVGIIQVDGLSIEILPKADKNLNIHTPGKPDQVNCSLLTCIIAL